MRASAEVVLTVSLAFSQYFTKPDQTEQPARASLRKDCTPQHVQWRLQANEIIQRIYLSDLYTATSETALNDLGITHVVSLTAGNVALPVKVDAHMHIHIADLPHCDLLQHFEETTDFIRDGLAASSSNRVLVHCVWGMSRSVSAVMAYLMATRHLFYHEALDIVKERRSLACPNTGFTTQLVRYGVELGIPLKRAKASRRKTMQIAPQDWVPTSFGPQTNFPQALSTMYGFLSSPHLM